MLWQQLHLWGRSRGERLLKWSHFGKFFSNNEKNDFACKWLQSLCASNAKTKFVLVSIHCILTTIQCYALLSRFRWKKFLNVKALFNNRAEDKLGKIKISKKTWLMEINSQKMQQSKFEYWKMTLEPQLNGGYKSKILTRT